MLVFYRFEFGWHFASHSFPFEFLFIIITTTSYNIKHIHTSHSTAYSTCIHSNFIVEYFSVFGIEIALRILFCRLHSISIKLFLCLFHRYCCPFVLFEHLNIHVNRFGNQSMIHTWMYLNCCSIYVGHTFDKGLRGTLCKSKIFIKCECALCG